MALIEAKCSWCGALMDDLYFADDAPTPILTGILCWDCGHAQHDEGGMKDQANKGPIVLGDITPSRTIGFTQPRAHRYIIDPPLVFDVRFLTTQPEHRDGEWGLPCLVAYGRDEDEESGLVFGIWENVPLSETPKWGAETRDDLRQKIIDDVVQWYDHRWSAAKDEDDEDDRVAFARMAARMHPVGIFAF